MSKPDFNFQQHITVPDAWIEKALAIPSAEPQPTSQPTVLHLPRRLIAAASVVLVAALSVSLYFQFRNNNKLPIAPAAPATESGTAPSATAVEPSQSEETPVSQPATQPPTVIETQLSTDSQGRVTVITVITTITEEYASETAGTSPSDSPAQRPSANPSVRPTEKPQKPTASPPTVLPTQKTTQPTDQPPAENPTVDIGSDSDIRTLEVVIPAESIPMIPASENDDGYLYICVYDSAGRPLGSGNLYSPEHRLDYRQGGESYEAHNSYTYKVEYDASAVPSDRFTYRIYLSDGTVLMEKKI